MGRFRIVPYPAAAMGALGAALCTCHAAACVALRYLMTIMTLCLLTSCSAPVIHCDSRCTPCVFCTAAMQQGALVVRALVTIQSELTLLVVFIAREALPYTQQLQPVCRLRIHVVANTPHTHTHTPRVRPTTCTCNDLI